MSSYNNDIIRIRIHKAIHDSKMSRSKVTELADVSYPNLTRFLNKNKEGGISLEILTRLADVLNVPVSYFLGQTDKGGNKFVTIDDLPLTEEWDIQLKRIMTMSKKDRSKVLAILKTTIDVLIR